MLIDELDKTIFLRTFEASKSKKEVNHWELSKEIVEKLKGPKFDILDRNAIYCKINYKLKMYCHCGIFFPSINGDEMTIDQITKENRKNIIFNMDSDKVTIVRRKCSDGMKNGVWIRIE